MSSSPIDSISGQIKGNKGPVDVKIDIFKKAENGYSFTILPLKPGKVKGKQAFKPIGADVSLRHVMDNTFFIFSDINGKQSLMIEVHDQEDKKKRYLLQSCDDEVEVDLTFSSQDTPIALPNH